MYLILRDSAPRTVPSAERIAVDGSVSLTTPNASLLIEGTAGPVVISNAGLCNLRLPSDTAWLPVQPCRITGEPPPAQAGEAAAAVVAQQAGAFNQTCFVNTSESSGLAVRDMQWKF